MKITKKTRYGLRALIFLARNSDQEGKRVRIKEISEAENIPVPYLEQILNKLKKAGMIEGKRGPYGGYSLLKPEAEIRMIEIFKILEGALSVVDCDIAAESCKKEDCSTVYLWNKINTAMVGLLYNTTLEELITDYNNKMNRKK
ncbi:MAG: hypothetical protein B6I28_02585 [Fusobacteriia bacterium 4572_132]|nr:MAG: hypothetical protein B6I28_02585 [Fusobacteriia bacterium 4572_132]